MSVITESGSRAAFRSTVRQCIEHARANGVGDFHLGRRSQPRLPYVHPVRYCLGSAVCEEQSQPGYTLNISLEGMALCCQEALDVGKSILVRLPLSDGSTVWMEGTVAYCEPDAEHYRVGIAFLVPDEQDFAAEPS